MKLKELQKSAKNILGIDILETKKEMVYQKERKIELLFKGTYKGYEFYVLNLGTHPTAYVNIPTKHPYYHKDYRYIEDKIDVHGGLTYSKQHLYTSEGVSIKGWFIGWDYAHWNDYLGYFMDNEKLSNKRKKWTTDEMIQECLDVIDQLEEKNDIR